MYARALVDALNRRGGPEHQLCTIFVNEDQVTRPDVALEVPRGRMRRFGLDPRALLRLKGVVEKTGPHLLIAHGGEPAKYLSMAARTRPYVYLVIGSEHPRLRNPLRRGLRHFYVSRASAVVAVSDQLAGEVERSVPSVRGRVRVIPNGRDPEVYRPADTPSPGLPRVLFIGHFDAQKRPEWFVEVIGSLRSRGIGFTAAMVGGGREDAALADNARAVGIELLGARDDVPSLLATADVLVFTSRPPEGMPGVLIEAGLAGLPVVTTDVPGANEIVEDGVTGLIVSVDDKPELVDAVESLLADRSRRHTMGTAARERCARLFSLESSAAEWETLLAEIPS